MKKIWKNKKYGERQYKGSYQKTPKGERFFVLTTTKELKKNNEFVVESYQAAKKLGWF